MADRTRLELATSAVTGQRSKPTELPVHNQAKNQQTNDFLYKISRENVEEYCHFLSRFVTLQTPQNSLKPDYLTL